MTYLVSRDSRGLLINYYLLLILGEGLDLGAIGEHERVELHLYKPLAFLIHMCIHSNLRRH